MGSPRVRVAVAGLVVGVWSFAVPPARGEHEGCLEARLERASWTAEAAPSNLWDEKTGRDVRNFPPDRLADHTRMVLRIDIPDMLTPQFSASQTLTLTPVGAPLRALRLDAVGMDIDSVTLEGVGPAAFSHDGTVLTIPFDPPLPVGHEATLTTTYRVVDPPDGLFWTVVAPRWPGAESHPQIHTQGQPDTNRFWFPSHDFPNERLATELIVTVPAGYTVSSNGELASETTQDGRTTFHWRQDKPHAAYLVSLIVGKFEVVDVSRRGDPVRMPVYVPIGKGALVEGTYGRTRDMLEVFARRFDEPYPWDRYAQLLAWNFAAGGMENTAATTMFDTALRDERSIQDADLDGLIAHELGHQWFGDLLTCKSWEHLWLNEGFATYTEALWFEERDGHDAGYLDDMHANIRGVARRDAIRADDEDGPDRPGMVSNVYASPNEVFGRASNPYPKGASVLHMLRVMLGDEVFFRGLALYVDRHKFGEVETADFRQVMEEVSGLSLERFFEQWTVRPGTPQVEVSARWDSAASELALTVEQTQRIDHRVPAFVFDLPVHVEAGGQTTVVQVPVSERRHERRIPLPAEPDLVVVDPGLAVLMNLKVAQPARRTIAAMERGPTVPARLDAARWLREQAGAATTEALARTLANPAAHVRVRQTAAESLGALGEADALLAALEAGVNEARVRRSVVSALASTRDPRALDAILPIARDPDQTPGVRAEAIQAVGALGTKEAHGTVLLALLDEDSYDEQVRRAALGALARLDVPEGLDGALRFTGPDWLARLRTEAVNAAATLAVHGKDRAYRAVAPLLEDRVHRVHGAARNALVRIKDERGVADLRRVAETHRLPEFRDAARSAADRLAGAIARGEDGSAAQEAMGRLQREVEALRGKIEKLEREAGKGPERNN